MKTITIDFETYWSTAEKYSLSRRDMTAMDYIMDPRFHITCVCAKVDDGPVLAWSGHDIDGFDVWLRRQNTDHAIIRSHNGIFFDFLILGWHFGVKPAMWQDSMLMARPLMGRGQRASLGALAQWLGLPAKLDEIHNTDGVKLEDFTPDAMARYMEYCKRDVELCDAICDRLVGCWAPRDLRWMDLCCRMGADPRFVLDGKIIRDGITAEDDRQRNLFLTLGHELAARGVALPPKVWQPVRTPEGGKRLPSAEEAIKKSVSSIPLCASLIESLGHYVPMKTSEKQQKRVPALAKTDTEFTEMVDYGDKALEALVEARLASRNTMRMSRLTRMASVHDKMDGHKMPVFLEPFATVTGRNAGKQKMNIQNFASRMSKSNPEGKGNPLRRSMRAPEGYSVIDADSSQIEVRVLGALTGEEAICGPLIRKEDIYCAFGTSFYNRTITKADKHERNVSKAAVLGNGYGQGGFGFQRYAKVTAGVTMSLDEAQEVVDSYRRINSSVVRFWQECDEALNCMLRGQTFSFGVNGCVRVEGNALILPSGRRIYYRELQWRDQINPINGEVVGREKVYFDPRPSSNGKPSGWRRIYGSLACENICQGTANDIISEQAVAIYERDGYAPVAQVHDALVYVEQTEYLDSFLATIKQEMSRTPDWLPFIPLAMEAEVGPSYGEMEEVPL